MALSLGDYLRARRALVTPTDLGLPATGRRRVPGLRREEVAESAGLSTDYYVRLEQGRADRPSPEVVAALARALRLGPAERAHLKDLAGPERRPTTTAAPTHVVKAITAPALIMTANTDVTAWNPLAAKLIADFPNLPGNERNMARRIFLDPNAAKIHPDWDEAARNTVGILRMAAGRGEHDPELVRELADASSTFRALWASHHVHEKTGGVKRFHHPATGDIELRYETFRTHDHFLVIYTTENEEALEVLRRA